MQVRHIGWGALLVVASVVLVWLILTKPVHAPALPAVATSTPLSATTTVPSTPRPLHELVHVSEPVSGVPVGQHFSVVGDAPGTWYFEASFPIQVRDKADNKIGQTVAQAQGDWMTTEQVPFRADVVLDTAYSGPATLVLLRDNPSGLPENDDSLELPIVIQ